MKKICAKCGVEKPIKAFYKTKTRTASRCSECQKDDFREQIANMKAHDPDKYEVYLEKLRANNKISNERRRVKEREAYEVALSKQGGVCAICKRPPLAGKRLFKDHDHVTNKQRKLLCGDCNYGLGCFKDDPVRLKSAAVYLMRHH